MIEQNSLYGFKLAFGVGVLYIGKVLSKRGVTLDKLDFDSIDSLISRWMDDGLIAGFFTVTKDHKERRKGRRSV